MTGNGEKRKRIKNLRGDAQSDRWLKNRLRSYRGRILRLGVLTVLSASSSVAFAWIVRFLVDGATDGNFSRMWLIGGIICALLLFSALVNAAGKWYTEKTRAQLAVGLRSELFSSLLRSDYADINARHSGDWMTRLTSDVAEVAGDSVALLPGAAGICVQLVGAAVALFSLDTIFTCIFLLGGGMVALIGVLCRKSVKRAHRETAESEGAVRSFMQESVASSLTVKAYGAETTAAAKADTLLDGYFSRRMRKNKINTGLSVSYSLLSSVGYLFAVVWCGVEIFKGTLSFGEVLSVLLLLGQLQRPLLSAASLMPAVYARSASAKRLYDVAENLEKARAHAGKTAFSERGETDAEKQAGSTAKTFRSLNIDALTFSYGGDAVFTDASAYLRRGEFLCVVGESGAGKSTLVKLLLGVYPPSAGQIALCSDTGSVPVGEIADRFFAYVPQGNFLFSGTIKENLLFFSPGADEEKISDALRVSCSDFVRELPDGLDTPLSERGDGLSEGQKQRLAVARALLSDRPLLILDEATSALDEETENRLLNNLRALKDKTCILVAHRPAARRLADRVWRIEKGKIFDECADGKRSGKDAEDTD